ncbi:unnamed protein product [Heterobilharzia americana]|nr:unnamed protein product [Heterobilharzia americana]
MHNNNDAIVNNNHNHQSSINPLQTKLSKSVYNTLLNRQEQLLPEHKPRSKSRHSVKKTKKRIQKIHNTNTSIEDNHSLFSRSISAHPILVDPPKLPPKIYKSVREKYPRQTEVNEDSIKNPGYLYSSNNHSGVYSSIQQKYEHLEKQKPFEKHIESIKTSTFDWIINKSDTLSYTSSGFDSYHNSIVKSNEMNKLENSKKLMYSTDNIIHSTYNPLKISKVKNTDKTCIRPYQVNNSAYNAMTMPTLSNFNYSTPKITIKKSITDCQLDNKLKQNILSQYHLHDWHHANNSIINTDRDNQLLTNHHKKSLQRSNSSTTDLLINYQLSSNETKYQSGEYYLPNSSPNHREHHQHHDQSQFSPYRNTMNHLTSTPMKQYPLNNQHYNNNMNKVYKPIKIKTDMIIDENAFCLLNAEQFRDELGKIVTPGDPRADLQEICKIGKGSTGVVYLMQHSPTKHYVAVKKMNIFKQQRRELLFNEVIIMQTYPHPNIVEMFGSYLIGNELWVAMEYLEGGALTNIVTRTLMSEKQIATVCRDVLRALAFLHDHGIIHRDVKSDSILLSIDGRVKLSDFGFCARVSPEHPRRRSLVGTPYWMSPEVISRLPYNTSVDVWSMGVLLIEMVDGEPSFFNEPPLHVMRHIQRDGIPYLLHPHKSSRKLNSFLGLMLVRDPLRRATAAQLLLHPFLLLASTNECLLPLLYHYQSNMIMS